MMTDLHPALALAAGALAAAVLPARLNLVGIVGGPLLALLAVLGLEPGTTWPYRFLGLELTVLKADALALVFGLVFSLMALLGAVYALHVRGRGEHVAALLYAAGSLGVVFAGDWLTLFFWWELMAASSVFLVWFRRRPSALAAGFRYLMVHFLGGNLLLAGVLILLSRGEPAVNSLAGEAGPAFWLVLLGVSINAAIPPLHAWLTDAYPEGTVTGSVFLSAFTTKVAVYVLIRVFAGTGFLVWAGVLMALYGVVYAVLENDIRRLLAYHIISQVGYMVAAVGMGTELALNGAAAHAFSHILYKSLLFMGAGAVVFATGREKLTELGGIARRMPWTVILYMVGAFSISGVPLFNGFVSKSLVVSAAGEGGWPAAEILLTMASIGTFLHTGLKLPYFMFFGPDRGLHPKKLPANMHLAMAGGAFLCILIGVYPLLLYARLPFPLHYEPYTADHVISSLQLLLATGAGFWLLLKKLGGEPTISLDTDWLYRKPLAALLGAAVGGLKNLRDGLENALTAAARQLAPCAANPFLLPAALAAAFRPARPDLPAAYDEHRYRFPVGLNMLLGVLFLSVLFAIMLAG